MGVLICARVYPDKVHIDSHEPNLTDDELLWQTFLGQIARAVQMMIDERRLAPVG